MPLRLAALVRLFPAVLVAAAILAGPVTSRSAENDLDARRAAAGHYLSSEPVQQMLDSMISSDAIMSQVRLTRPETFAQISPSQLNAIFDIVAEEAAANRADLEAAMIEATAQTFTLAEIEALDAFYRSPEGSAVMAKMQPMMDRFLALAGPGLKQMSDRIELRVTKELE